MLKFPFCVLGIILFLIVFPQTIFSFSVYLLYYEVDHIVKYKRKASKTSVKIAGKFWGPARESTILCSRVLCLWELTGCHVVPSLAVYCFGSTDLSVLSSFCSSTFSFESSSSSTILRMKSFSTGSSSESFSSEGIYIPLQKILYYRHYPYRFHFLKLRRLESMGRLNYSRYKITRLELNHLQELTQIDSGLDTRNRDSNVLI